MPANASIIVITTNGQKKYYVRHASGIVEPYVREKKNKTGEW